MRITTGLLLLLPAVALTGCGEFPTRDTGPTSSMALSNTPDPVPRWEPRSRYGNQSYQVSGINYEVMKDAAGYVQKGQASWYGLKFHGQYTSSREVYNMYGMSAAHRTLPLPTYVRVTNLANGRSCIVRVNDRGPFHSERLIDLSYAAASKLGIVESGTAMVEVRAIEPGVATDEPRVSDVVVTPQPGFRPADESLQAMPLAEPVAVTAAATPSETTTTTTPTAAAIRLFVQAGAFASRDNAERLKARLTDEQKLNATVRESVNAAQRVLYLVRVGPLGNAAEADRVTARLKELGLGTPRLIRE